MRPNFPRPPENATILAVDDNPASLRLIQFMLEKEEYKVLTAESGKEALDILRTQADIIDIILLDRIMPEMDGIEVCTKIKADEKLRAIPIIMQTAAGQPQEIKEGIEAGVFYYLVKPLVADTFLSIVASAKQKHKKYRQDEKQNNLRREALTLVRSLTCSFRTIEEGDKLATFLAQFFPNSDLVFPGICELFLNAVEHGNLDISYEEKSRLIQSNTWQEEVDRRLADPRYSERLVSVFFERTEGFCVLQISDAGQGFAWQKYLQVDPSRAMHNHGRGIAMANMMSFDELQYNDKGNEVTCRVRYARGSGDSSSQI